MAPLRPATVGIWLCLAAAWLALAACKDTNRTATLAECEDADGCGPAATPSRPNSSPFLIASITCVVAFCMFLAGLKFFLVWRSKRFLGEDWNNGSEMGGGIFRPGGMMNRIMRWQRPPTLAKQKEAEDLVALIGNDISGTVWIACKPRKNAQYDEPMKMTPIHWFRASDDSSSDDPMELYAGPKFGVDERNVQLDSEGNILSMETIVDIPDCNANSVPGRAIPLGEPCCICFENKADVRLYPCGHSPSCRLCFMRTLLTWQQEHKPNCPMCRKTITTFTIHDSVSGPVGMSCPATRDNSAHSRRTPRHPPVAPHDSSRHSNSSFMHSRAFNGSGRDVMHQHFTVVFARPPTLSQQDPGNFTVRSVADRLQQLVPSSHPPLETPASLTNNDVTVELGFHGGDDASLPRTQPPNFVSATPPVVQL